MCKNSVVNGTDEKDKILKLLQSFLLAPFAPSGPEGPPRTSTFSSRQSKKKFQQKPLHIQKNLGEKMTETRRVI